MAKAMNSVFRIDPKAGKVTGYASLEIAMKNGNSPCYASASDLESNMSVAHINKMIVSLTGKADAKPFDDPGKAAKVLWPLLRKKSASGATVKPEEKAVKKPKAPKDPKAPKKPRVTGTTGNRAKIMTPQYKENPSRPGSKSFDAMQMVLDDPGKTFQHYVDKGARINTLNFAIRNNTIKLSDPK